MGIATRKPMSIGMAPKKSPSGIRYSSIDACGDPFALGDVQASEERMLFERLQGLGGHEYFQNDLYRP